MPAQELERIYDLKTQGLASVLKDIERITEAFNAAAAAKERLGELKNSDIGLDASHIQQVNTQITKLNELQDKTIEGFKNISDKSEDASGELKDLGETFNNISGNTNKLGGNLTNAANGLLKLQSSLNVGGLKEYDALINKLVGDLAVLDKRHAANKQQFENQGAKVISDEEFLSSKLPQGGGKIVDNKVMVGTAEVKSLSEEYQQLHANVDNSIISYEDYLKEQMEITSQSNQLVVAIQELNRAFNSSLSGDERLLIQKSKLIAIGQEENSVVLHREEILKNETLAIEKQIIALEEQISVKKAMVSQSEISRNSSYPTARKDNDIEQRRQEQQNLINAKENELNILKQSLLIKQEELGANRALSESNEVLAQSLTNEAVSLKLVRDEMVINAKEENDALAQQIENASSRQELNRKISLGASVLTGEFQAELDKQELAEQKNLEKLQEIAAKKEEIQRKIRGNQELKGLGIVSSMEQDEDKKQQKQNAALPQNAAIRKQEQQELRQETELIKNKNIAADEEVGYMRRQAAELNVLRIQYRNLTKEELFNEEVGGKMRGKIQLLNAELVKLNKEIGDHSRSIGNYSQMLQNAGPLLGQFVRQLVRGVGSLVIWGVLFEAIFKVTDAIKAAIPGTEAYEQAQEKLQAANEALIKSFKELNDEMLKLRDQQNTLYEGMDEGVDGAKRNEAAIKALGIEKNKQGEADVRMAEARMRTLQAEEHILDNHNKILKENVSILEKGQKDAEEFVAKPETQVMLRHGEPESNINVQYELYNKLSTAVSRSNIPFALQTKFIEELNKGYDKGANLLEIYHKNLLDVGEQLKKNEQELKTNTEAQQNLSTELKSKNEETSYKKRIELESQFRQVKSENTLLGEKEQLESTDRIIKDNENQYSEFYKKIRKDKDDFIQSIAPQNRNGEDYDKSISLFDSILGKTHSNETIDKLNKLIENKRKADVSSAQYLSKQASEQASNSKFYSEYGTSDYGFSVNALMQGSEAQRKQTELKALQDKQQAEAESNTIAYGKTKEDQQKELSKRLIQIEEERKNKIKQINDAEYRDLLNLGMSYFEKISKLMAETSDIVLKQINTISLDAITKVLNGRGSQGKKDRKIEKINKNEIINTANEDIVKARTQLEQEGGINDQVDRSQKNLDAAKIVGDENKIIEAEKALNVVKAKQIELDNQIAKAKNNKAVANKKEIIDAQELKDALVKVGTSIANDYMQLLEKQDAYKQEVQKRSMDWNKRLLDSETQSNNERLNQDKAFYIAQLAASKEKMKTDQKRAEQQALIDYASAAISLIPVAVKTGGVASVVIQESALAAIFLAKENMLKSAPVYGEGTGDGRHPGGLAWLGDKYEHELIVSPNVPTLMNLQKGSQVIPFSKLGNMGSELKPPRFSSSSYSSSNGNGGGGQIDVHEKAISNLYGIIGEMGKHLANQKIVYEPQKATAANKKLYYKTHKA